MIQNKLQYAFKINNVDMYTFLSKRDFSLSQKDRIDHLNDILYTEGGYLNEYLECFLCLEYKEGQSIFNPSSKQPLSHDMNFCTGLESLANYILFSPDGEKLTQKSQYNIFKDEKEFRNKSRSNYSLTYDEDVEVDSAIDYLLDINHNYMCETSQKIYAPDLKKHPELIQYKDAIDHYVKLIKTIPNDKKNMKERKKIGDLIASLRSEQCVLKTMLDGTIIFKHVFHGGEKLSEPDANGFDYSSVERMFKNSNPKQLTPFGELGDVLQVILENIEKSEEDVLILNCLLNEEKPNYSEVARKLNIDPRVAQQCMLKIRNKVIREYMKLYEDWYFTYEDFGWYKKCSVCGEIKLLSTTYFSKNAGSSDGFRANCKKCQ